VKSGGDQIEYEDQSPKIQQLFLEATRKTGVEAKMAAFG
jgi:hypothetical protein